MQILFRIIWAAISASAVGMFLFFPRRKWYQYTLAAMAGCLLVWVVSQGFVLGVRRFFGLSDWDFNRRELYSLTVRTMGYLLALLCAWVIRQLRMGVRFRWIGLSVLLPLLSICMLMVLLFIYLGRNDLSESTFFFCCVLEAGNIAAAALVHSIQKSTSLLQEMALLHQQLQIQLESITSLEKSYRAQRQATHDYRGQLQTVHTLLSGGKAEAAEALVSQLLDEQSQRVFTVNSGHPIVDAVVHQKCQAAREMGLEVDFRVNDLSRISMQMKELVVLLSNLLDNAIEGCARLEGQRKLECAILLQDGIFISIRNTSPEVIIHGKHIPTSKEPRHEHGFGLKTVCRILDEHKAEYHFRWEDGWFEFAAEIPNERA